MGKIIGYLEKKTYFIITIPALLLFSGFFVFPVINGFYYSLTDWNGISKVKPFIGIDNFIRITGDPRIIRSLFFTFGYAASLLILTVAISLAISLLLNLEIKHRSFYRSLFFFPSILSLITVGLIFSQIFFQVIPALGKSLHIGWLENNLLARTNTAFLGILFVSLWQGLALPTVLFLAGLQSAPQELIEAAIIDGANSWQTFWKVRFPYLIPALSLVIILTIKSGLTSFDYIIALTNGGPGGTTETLSLLIYNLAFQEYKFGYSISVSIIMFFVIGFISIVQMKSMNHLGVNE